MKKVDLLEKANISSNVLAKMGKDQPVSMETLKKICIALNCNIGDIVDYVNYEEKG